MKFSLSWLKNHWATDASAEEIAARLNAIGLEVEALEDRAAALAGFLIARVLSAAPHPNADKLQILSVDAGADINDGKPLQIVCGAPNARTGLVGVLGLPGAIVPNGSFELKISAIRGVESHGMMCSARELGLGDAHEGIIELPCDTQIGMAFAEHIGADPVFDVAITPNRPDCMGVYGIARDLAASGMGTLLPVTVPKIASSYPCPVDIRIDDPEACPAFIGRVIRGVSNGASPVWMQERLVSAGQRPISALVDITNYVMLTYGRPAHAYDLAKLSGSVVARAARQGEVCRALNGKDYTLDAGMTVIADDAGIHDIAGIMGGEHSGCSPTTRDVLLEVAYFTPTKIGATARKLNLTSDARTRFERGVDPGFLADGLDLLTGLILDICGGSASDALLVGSPPSEAEPIAYQPSLSQTLGGITIAEDEQRRILEALGFKVTPDWQVSAPGWRGDIEGAADLVEEVVRIHGLDRVESVALPRTDAVARPTATSIQKLERRLRRAAAARGMNEAITWSFIPEADAVHFAGQDLAGQDSSLWLLTNPISEEMKAMRPSLLPGLLRGVHRNLARGASRIALFEIGRRYLRGEGGLSDERPSLALVLAGEKRARHWESGRALAYDAFSAKAEVLALLAEAGAPMERLQVMGGAGPQFHPGQSATLRLGPKNTLARFGMLHPSCLRAFDIAVPVAVAEIFLDALPVRKGAAGFARSAYAPPALQAVMRDFAFLVAADRPAGDLVRAVQGADKAHIVAVRLFDDFRGAGVGEGQKSLALEVTLQPGDKSFDEATFKAITERIVKAAEKLGAELRA